MRHLIQVLTILLLLTVLAEGRTIGQYYYRSNGQEQPLLVNDSLISVKLVDGSKETLTGLMTSSPVLVDTFRYFGITSDYWVVGIQPEFTYAQAADSLLATASVANVNPVFFSTDSLMLFLSDDIIVQFEDNTDQQYIDSLVAAYQLTPVVVPLLREEVRLLHLEGATPAAALSVANAFYQIARVRYSHPDFIAEIRKFSLPNDEFFGDQWNFHNTGQSGGKPGADLDAVRAWNITTGDSLVVVAVIDEGFQWQQDWQHPEVDRHPDVDYSRVRQGYDFVGRIPP